jgi:Tol biopolymer transport system component
VSVEGFAFWPQLSADGSTLCYRVAHTAPSGQMPSELWKADLTSGRTERLLPGYSVTGYDVSGANWIAAAVTEADGTRSIWVSPLDKHEPPHRVEGVRGSNPRFVSSDEIVYLEPKAAEGFELVRIRLDGSDRRALRSVPGYTVGGVSPDGSWVAVTAAAALQLVSTKTGESVSIVAHQQFAMRARWNPDGSQLLLSFQYDDLSAFGGGRTYVIPLRDGALPPIPAGGFTSEAQIAALPAVHTLDYGDVSPGTTSGVYAYSQTAMMGNLFRIPLPR